MSKKLSLVNTSASSLKEVWECFIIPKTSKCVSDATLSNYHHHLRAIAKHLDIEMPLDELSKHKKYQPSTPEATAENILNRDFWAKAPNEKWATDVMEFKWYEGPAVHKLYLSAILEPHTT